MLLQFTGYEQIDTKRMLHLYREGTEVNLRYFYPQAAADPASSEPFPVAFTLCWRRTAAG